MYFKDNMKYTTKQGKLLIEYFENNNDRHITASELIEHFKDSIAKATVYRQLEKLCDAGIIRKYTIGIGKENCFQLNETQHCEMHFHLMCNECKKIIHLECKALNEISSHICEEHGFELDSSKTVLYGKCSDCQNKAK